MVPDHHQRIHQLAYFSLLAASALSRDLRSLWQLGGADQYHGHLGQSDHSPRLFLLHTAALVVHGLFFDAVRSREHCSDSLDTESVGLRRQKSGSNRLVRAGYLRPGRWCRETTH